MASSTYTTRQGETVDIACLRFYGRTRDVTEMVLEANPGLAAMTAILPIGLTIVMPEFDMKPRAATLVKLWD